MGVFKGWTESRETIWTVEALFILVFMGLGLAPKSLLMACVLIRAFLADGVMFEPADYRDSIVFLPLLLILNPSLYVLTPMLSGKPAEKSL